VTASSEALHRDLADRKVELLIARRFGPDPDERMDFEYLFDDSFVVAVGAQSPWARRRKVELRELLDEPWVLPPPESTMSPIALEAFRASGLQPPRPAVVTLTPEVRMSLLATGRFITIFPASIARFAAKRSELKVLPIALPVAPVPSGILTLKNRSLGPAAKLFIERAREAAKVLA
jgi:DNA-binding transcriptional LysR family regulator